MARFALLLTYVGHPYGGWQIQPADSAPLPSVQSTLEAALERLTAAPTRAIASGRTDAGVNASGQVVHFETPRENLTDYNVLRALNTFLPPTIRVLAARRVSDAFHAQHDAIGKQYSYYWVLGRSVPAHLRYAAALQPVALDEEAMRTAASDLLGTHDFKVFQAAGAKPELSTRKTIRTAELSEVPFAAPGEISGVDMRMLRFRVIGDGFLKQMVRSIAGTLAWIGEGKLPVDRIGEVLARPDRPSIGPTAPPEGLWLERVEYPDPPFPTSPR